MATMVKDDHAPRVSVAIPVFNEEEVLPELLRRVGSVLDELPGGPHEMVLVDDGSRDRTLQLLAAAAQEDARVVAVSLSRNFGHQAAFSAALDHAQGDVVVLMDGDLQDSPEAIPRFLAEYAKGADVVYAVRTDRKEGLLLRACYALHYRLIARLAKLELPVGAGDFSLLSRRAVDSLSRCEERHRYLRGLRTWVGFRQVGVEVEREARFAGTSKYSIVGLFRLASDGIFAFSRAPIRAATMAGLCALVVSLGYVGYAIYTKLVLDQSPQGFTALIVAIVFLTGVQLCFLGIIGEYVGRIYDEVKRRPLYLVDRVVRKD